MTPEQLADAKLKYHLLVTGGSAREVVDQNGERISFNAANADRLLAYIRFYDPTFMAVPAAARVSPPIRFFF